MFILSQIKNFLNQLHSSFNMIMIDRHLWIANCLTQTLSDHNAAPPCWVWLQEILRLRRQFIIQTIPGHRFQYPPPTHPQHWIIHNRQLKTQVQNKVVIAEGSAVQKILLGQKVRADTWKQGQTRLKNDEDPKAPSPVLQPGLQYHPSVSWSILFFYVHHQLWNVAQTTGILTI